MNLDLTYQKIDSVYNRFIKNNYIYLTYLIKTNKNKKSAEIVFFSNYINYITLLIHIIR